MPEEEENEKEFLDMHDESVCTGVGQYVMRQAAKQQEEEKNEDKENNK